MKMTAKQVQEMLNVEDYEVLAHGYTFDRNTVDIYFVQGYLVKVLEDGGLTANSAFFEPHYFKVNIKRWYAEDFHPGLLQLFETFGLDLALTSRY